MEDSYIYRQVYSEEFHYLFRFKTENQLEYVATVDLIPSLKDSIFYYNVFNFGFYCRQIHTGSDKKIGATIIKIINNLINYDSDNAIIYTCDSSDYKEENRNRLFNIWFNKERAMGVYKFDEDIIMDSCIMHTSLLIHFNNSFYSQIVNMYKEDLAFMRSSK